MAPTERESFGHDWTTDKVVHVQLRVNPTPGKYFQRHIHSAGFVEGRDACDSCDAPLKTVDEFAMNVADLSALSETPDTVKSPRSGAA